MDATESVTAVLALADVLKCAQALVLATGTAAELDYLGCDVQTLLDALFGYASEGVTDLALLLSDGLQTI